MQHFNQLNKCHQTHTTVSVQFFKKWTVSVFPRGKMLMCDTDRERKGRKERKIKGYFQK